MSVNAEIPRGWIETTLEKVVDIRDDLRRPVNAEERADRVGPYPYYGATGQVGYIDDFLMDGEFVLLGEDGAPFLDPNKAKAYLVKGKSWVNNHAHVLNGIDGTCTNRFLLHALNHTDYRGFANGTTRLKLTQGAMRRLPLRLPPLNEQRRIVAKIEELFSDLDAGVAALERVKANLKRYRASVLKAAVEGRLTAQWRKEHPSVEPADKLLARILTERRQKWEAAQLAKFQAAGSQPPANWRERFITPPSAALGELPSLPAGWTWACLSQLGSVERGKFQHRPRNEPRFYGGNHPFVQIGDLPRDGGKIIGYQSTLNDEGLSISRKFPAGTLFIAIVGATIGNTGTLTFDACAPDSMVAIRGHSSIITRYVDLFLRSQKLQIRSQASASGGQPNINLGLLLPLAIPCPPLSEQVEIVSEVERVLSVAEMAESEIGYGLSRAARLRQSILKRAFEGKLVAQDAADEPANVLLARLQHREGKVNVGYDDATEIAPAIPMHVAVKRKEPKGINFKRGALASYIIRRLHNSPNFGRTQLEKALHLTQTHLGVDLAFEFKRKAAGPFDEVIYKVESLAGKQKWFTTTDTRHGIVRYTPGPRTEDRCGAAVVILGDQRQKLDEVLGHIAKMDTEQAELFATVYAAWNDLLIDKRPADDDAIVQEVHAWHPQKMRFTPDRIKTCIGWLRKVAFVPCGAGARTLPHSQESRNGIAND